MYIPIWCYMHYWYRCKYIFLWCMSLNGTNVPDRFQRLWGMSSKCGWQIWNLIYSRSWQVLRVTSWRREPGVLRWDGDHHIFMVNMMRLLSKFYLVNITIYSNLVWCIERISYYPLVIWHSHGKWPIYRWFTYSKWWFSMAMLVTTRG